MAKAFRYTCSRFQRKNGRVRDILQCGGIQLCSMYGSHAILEALKDSPYVLNTIPPRRIKETADRVVLFLPLLSRVSLNDLACAGLGLFGRGYCSLDAASCLDREHKFDLSVCLSLSITTTDSVPPSQLSTEIGKETGWTRGSPSKPNCHTLFARLRCGFADSSETKTTSTAGASRRRAEEEWMSLFSVHSLPVHTFRLGGESIYHAPTSTSGLQESTVREGVFWIVLDRPMLRGVLQNHS